MREWNTKSVTIHTGVACEDNSDGQERRTKAKEKEKEGEKEIGMEEETLWNAGEGGGRQRRKEAQKPKAIKEKMLQQRQI